MGRMFAGNVRLGYSLCGTEWQSVEDALGPRSGTFMNFKLVIFRDDGSKRVFALEPGVTTLGRKEDCTIRIPLAVVSRYHAEITVDDDTATLKNLGASNGTFLNNERIEQEDIAAGDQITIGPVMLLCQIDDEPSDKELLEIRARAMAESGSGIFGVGTSDHVSMSDDDVDPIAALEALASSADQTAIDPEDEE